MIEAKELKLNNWVIIDGDECILDEDAMEVLFSARNFSDLMPLPLTTQVLEACGFRLDSTNHFKCGYNETERLDLIYCESIYSTFEPNMHLEVITDPKTNEIRRIGIKGFTYDSPYCLLDSPYDLKYLHDLQNLYFSLTRKELIYSLP